ncbi:hypothetical protein CDEST_08171 [Colletotrichum destructivum]|uniref:Uncharacterized protein n=1 Tax=Colletotrichum destructivum TaxID=34406 RepID=A0AAX4IIA4_9PEZI|nr:hypothetical protein CDEST_08171 [Colletotrichum destructivum]
MAPRNLVAVELKDDWNAYMSTPVFLVHPTTRPMRGICSGTKAMLDLGQQRRGPPGNQWVSITPLEMTKTGLVSMFRGSESIQVEIPCFLLRIGVIVTRDFGAGVHEYDTLSAKHGRAVKGCFKAGELAVCDNFTLSIPEIVVIKRLRLNARSGFITDFDEYSIHRDFIQYGIGMKDFV